MMRHESVAKFLIREGYVSHASSSKAKSYEFLTLLLGEVG